MANCFMCGLTVPAGKEVAVPANTAGGKEFVFCPTCAPAGSRPVQTAPPPTSIPAPSPTAVGVAASSSPVSMPTSGRTGVFQSKKTVTTREDDEPNYVGGIFGGMVGGTIAAFIWYGIVALTDRQFFLVAAGIGWLVGIGVYLGAGGRGSFKLQLISMAIALLTMIYSNYLICRHFARDLELPLVADPMVTMLIVIEMVKAVPIILLFWAVALYGAYRVPSESEVAE